MHNRSVSKHPLTLLADSVLPELKKEKDSQPLDKDQKTFLEKLHGMYTALLKQGDNPFPDVDPATEDREYFFATTESRATFFCDSTKGSIWDKCSIWNKYCNGTIGSALGYLSLFGSKPASGTLPGHDSTLGKDPTATPITIKVGSK